MPDTQWKELSVYRIETARETLETARLLYENARYKDSINRSYYTIFSRYACDSCFGRGRL